MTSIRQDILPEPQFPSSIILHRVSAHHADDAARHLVRYMTLRDDSVVQPIGIAYHASTSDAGRVDFVAIANTTSIYIITLDGHDMFPTNGEFAILLKMPLEGGDVHYSEHGDAIKVSRLVGFNMSTIAIRVGQATRLAVRGVDLSSICSPNTWEPWSPAKIVAARLHPDVNKWNVSKLWMGTEASAQRDVGLQAWLAACVGSLRKAAISSTETILDTTKINRSEQAFLSKWLTQVDLLENKKPREVVNDFSRGDYNKEGKFQIHNSRYKTRVRRSDQTQVVMIDEKGFEFIGEAKSVKGRATTIGFQGGLKPIHDIQRVRVIGREGLTNPERARNELIFHLMIGEKDLRQSPFIRSLWFPDWKPAYIKPSIVDHDATDRISKQMKLNDSQRSAVHAMVADKNPIVVVHGPPGTGKTTTIAAASRIWDLCRMPVWIVAHSNVAVKNIAETLYKKEVNFTLLVSQEFYHEWHEHLYGEVEKHLIRSDELPQEKGDMERLLANSSSSIMLCTLSMVSNPALHNNGTFDVIPPERLVIDEASQINVYEFVSVFQRFQTTLQKVCFFGDPKQLPPFGQEHGNSMQTIFDLQHISQSQNDFFLNVQYRMPTQIGQFISTYVYNNRLRSQHAIQSWDCLAFIDAPRTGEEKVGVSSKNTGEIDVIVNLVRYYYRRLNFCVITPYDAQRAAIQKALENAGLPWESVFNLDSFQGNEADYVLVSLVRSSHAGFLVSLNRMNVLLSRCRKALIIVSSRGFLQDRGPGSQTLAGKLLSYRRVGHTSEPWIDWKSIANRSVDLPGVFVPRSKQPTYVTTSSSSSSYVFRKDGPAWQCGPVARGVGSLAQSKTPASSAHLAPDLAYEGAFPSLVRKMPLLKGSWGPSVFQRPHRHSLVPSHWIKDNKDESTGSSVLPHTIKFQKASFVNVPLLKATGPPATPLIKPARKIADYPRTTSAPMPFLYSEVSAARRMQNTVGVNDSKKASAYRPSRKSKTVPNDFIRSMTIHSPVM